MEYCQEEIEKDEKTVLKELGRDDENEENREQMFFSIINKKDFIIDELDEFL